jgi:ankyrin repeat protein
MQELQRRQKEAQILNDMLNDEAGAYRRSLEGRIEHNFDLQYNQNKNLFATGYSTIHKAACDGAESGIVFFLDKKSKPRVNVDDYDKFGICPIHYSAERGYDSCVKLLLKRGCNIDVPTTDGMTAFMYACKNNRLSTMRMLCENKADLLAVNRAGMSCAHFAAQLDHLEVFTLLVELNKAAKDAALADIADLEMAIENPDQAAADADKKARKEQHEKSEKERNKSEADIADDATAVSSTTASTAQTKEKEKKKEKKKTAGAPDLDEDPVETLRKKYEKLINLPDTAIVDIPSRNMTRPVHIAATYNGLKVLEFLIGIGAQINAPDTAGETSMHKAARRGNHDAYKMLKAAGGLEGVKNTSRETPLELLKDASMI